ncbi:sensor histidine kinase [Streptomyces olivoreticuli]|uniref:sensor histidine kinase n=1 Tax=Streptomyces olivoreticuli TaxID=68246 RepID=UPI000E26CD0F|nr:sensor histidine kinase [Streptomyces olivoreticuli]
MSVRTHFLRGVPQAQRDVPQAGAFYGPESGTRWFGLWDGFFAVSYFVSATLLFISGAHALAIGALTLMVPWYAGFGRPLMVSGTSGPRNLVFVGVLLLLFAVTTAFSLSGAFAMFAVVPMLIMSVSMPRAIAMVVAANLWCVAVVWFRGESLGLSVLQVLPIALLSIALSTLLGLWIQRVLRQSEERGSLIEDLQRSRERVARLSHEAGIAAERERLAREIHDTIAQGLTSIISLVQTVEAELDDSPALARTHLSLAGRVAKESLAEARDFVTALTPPALRGSSLVQAVRRQTDGLVAEAGLDARCTVQGTERPLPMAVSVVLLRSVQEAIANVRKHATRARTVEVLVAYEEETVRVVVRDDGQGFTPDDSQEGYGLRGMQARAAEINGSATVSSLPGQGTTIEVTAPLGAVGQEAVDE